MKKENGKPTSQPQEAKTSAHSTSLHYSPQKHLSQYSSINKSQLQEQNLDKDTYYTDYKHKTREIVNIMNNFLSKEAIAAKKVNLPGDYYVLKKNFDLLFSIFKV